MKRILSLFLTATYVIATAIGITYLTRESFHTARNSDGAWDDALLVLAFLLCFFLWAAIYLLGGYIYARRPSSQRRWLAIACYACIFLVPFLGCFAGKCLWEYEFYRNRRSADEVAESLRHHRQQYGIYPEALAQLGSPVHTTFQRGGCEHPLEYHRTEKGGFVLEYRYGWYCYRYASDEGKWARYD